MTEKEVREIVRDEGDTRYRKIEDCDEITNGVERDVNSLKTDVAVLKSLSKGIFAVASITAAFIIPACLKIIMGV